MLKYNKNVINNTNTLFQKDILILEKMVAYCKNNHQNNFLSNNVNQLYENFLKDNNNESYVKVLKNCLSLISIHEFFTQFVETLDDKKINLHQYSYSFMNSFVEKSMNELCDENIKKVNYKFNENLAIRIINLQVLAPEDLKKLVSNYNFDDYTKNNDFLNRIHSFQVMLQLLEVNPNFNPWTVITKDGNIETFWCTHVCALDHLIRKPTNKQTEFSEKVDYFIDNKKHWNHIYTSNTTNQDLKSRIFTFLVLDTKTQAFKRMKENINNLELSDYNLQVEDFIGSINDKSTLKDKFYKYGFFKLLESSNKKQTISSVEDFHSLINSNPKNIQYINTYKSFIKAYENIAKKNNDLDYENALLKVLNNQVKNIYTTGFYFSYKCYFPILSKYMDLPIDQLKEQVKKNHSNSYLTPFISFSSSTSNNSASSLNNLIEYMSTKNNINWNVKVEKDQCNLFASSLKAILQQEHISFRNTKLLNSTDNYFLNIFKNNLNEEEKIKTLEFIKNSWETDLLNPKQLQCYDSQYITFKSENKSIFVFLLQKMFEHIIEEKINIPSTLFDEKFSLLMDKFKKYNHSSIDELSITYNYLETLSSSMNLNGNKTKKSIKI